MILWTIQSADWWNKLQTDGSIVGDLSYVEADYVDAGIGEYFLDELQPAYEWLIEQMKQKLPDPPPNPNAYPLWAWYRWYYKTRKAPDLRYFRFHSSAGNNVRIRFEIDDRLVLLTDLESWERILDNRIIRPYNEEYEKEYDEYDEDEDIEPIPFTEEEKLKSWNLVYEFGYFGNPIENTATQATFWEIRLDQVKEVKEFTAIHIGRGYEKKWIDA